MRMMGIGPLIYSLEHEASTLGCVRCVGSATAPSRSSIRMEKTSAYPGIGTIGHSKKPKCKTRVYLFGKNNAQHLVDFGHVKPENILVFGGFPAEVGDVSARAGHGRERSRNTWELLFRAGKHLVRSGKHLPQAELIEEVT